MRRAAVFLLALLCCGSRGLSSGLAAAEPVADPAVAVSTPVTDATLEVESNAAPGFNISAFNVAGSPLLSTNVLVPLLSKYTGTNVSLDELVKAAAAVQTEYRNQGYPMMSVAIAREQITNGIVTLNVFQTALPQIVVSGKRYLSFTNSPGATPTNQLAAAPAVAPMTPGGVAAANAAPQVFSPPAAPASPAEMAQARDVLFQKMAELTIQEKDTRVHVVSTNAGPRFEVEKYSILGNTVLTPTTMAMVLTNIDGAYGTNVSFDGIRTVLAELQGAYRERGYVTVIVGLPQQKLTNATVKVQVTEGRLANINVTGNHYFSSNNVMRSLPSLHTNTVLNAQILQAELNRANANQDRQIYTVIGPGPDPGTSDLTLKVKDQLPLHAKVEFNNQNSPGTPDLRVNSSAVYNNLWQLEHTLGVQYGFSPQQYKQGIQGNQWPFYDLPLVANYSGFYRLPLGNPVPIEDVIASKPGSFGYDEATRRFNLPPPSGASELNLYASRSTIDTGVETLSHKTLFNIPGVRQVTQTEFQQGLTINEDVGFLLSKPLPQVNSLRSTLSGGLDYKIYNQENFQTNLFTFIEYTKGPNGNTIERITYVPVQTPTTEQKVDYLPLGLTYNGSLNNFMGAATLGLGLSANVWYSSSTLYTSASYSATNPPPNLYGLKSLQSITGSAESTGYWVILRPSYSQDIVVYTNWTATIRADGQWSSEPLISNEQYGIGGVNSVRGYHEGEVFGDTGWHLSVEQQTPPHVVGMVYGRTPLTIRGSVYMDCGVVYLLDPHGQPSSTELWGTGFGFVASVGSHWQSRFLFSLPLISTVNTPRDLPYFNFSLSAQF